MILFFNFDIHSYTTMKIKPEKSGFLNLCEEGREGELSFDFLLLLKSFHFPSAAYMNIELYSYLVRLHPN